MKDIHAISDKEWKKIVNRDNPHPIQKVVDWFKKMKILKYTDRIGISTNKWMILFVRSRKYWHTSTNVWHFFVIPTIEITKDYDLKLIRLYWLKFIAEIEVRKLA